MKTVGKKLLDTPGKFSWPCCPEATTFVANIVASFTENHNFAQSLSRRMLDETSTCLFDWTDHLRLPENNANRLKLTNCGFLESKVETSGSDSAYSHPHAQLPRIVLSPEVELPSIAIKVDSLHDFQVVHKLSTAIEGYPFGRFRQIKIEDGDYVFTVLERRGYQGYIIDSEAVANSYLRALEKCAARSRHFTTNSEGLKVTLSLVSELSDEFGPAAAASIFLQCERFYWQTRNSAGNFQKWRQDSLGLGWANHDHHTFRSSRQCFSRLIEILSVLGFVPRERFSAGRQAGWGAQIMEQPDAGLVVFADLDLLPSETSIDFSRVELSDLEYPGTVGLWCALHGESILQAGMHHLEAQFDFYHLANSMEKNGYKMMNPFTDLPYLKQAFFEGELWSVSEKKVAELKKSGVISSAAANFILRNGAVGSHLENLQRWNGFKGFNQNSVSTIIKQVNPERLALKQ